MGGRRVLVVADIPIPLEYGAFGVICTGFGYLLWWLLTKHNKAIEGNTNVSRAVVHTLMTMQQQFLVHDLTTRGLNGPEHTEQVCQDALTAYKSLHDILTDQQKFVENAMKAAEDKK